MDGVSHAYDPYTFILTCIWLLTGVQAIGVFLVGRRLGRSWLCGVAAYCTFIFGLYETTRVHANPLLRYSS
jgi:hypothetical protein